MTRSLLCAGLLLAVLAPAPAFAVPTHVWVTNSPNSAGLEGKLCIDASSNGATTFAVRAPDGQVLEAATAAEPIDTTCDGSSGRGFVADLTSLAAKHYPAGALGIATQDGVSVTFNLPLAVHDSIGDGPNNLHVRNLPSPATVRVKNVLAATPTTGGSYDNPSIASGDRNILVSATMQRSDGIGIPYDAVIDPDPFVILVTGRDITVNGLNPLGVPAAAALYLPDGTTLVDSVALRPRVGTDTRASASFDRLPVANAIVRVVQADWFSHAVKAGAAAITAAGFTASAPADQGAPGVPEAAKLDATLTFATTDAFCPTFPTALTCTVADQFVVPGDSLTVTVTDPDGDTFQTTATKPGSTGSLDDGSYFYDAGTPNQKGTVNFTNAPVTAGADPYTEEDDPVGSDADGLVDVSFYFSAHVLNLARVAPKGPAFGTPAPPAFQFNLDYAQTGNAVSGKTYPGARVALTVTRGFVTDEARVVAGADGSFSATFSDLRTGDEIDVVAAEPNTHDTTTSTTFVGRLVPKIAGIADGDSVRGTVTPTVAGAGLARIVWAASVYPVAFTFNASAAPFGWPIDTTTWDDGIYRLEATGVPAPSATDYIYVTIDNTAPDGSAGPTQTVAPGRKVVFVTGASDDGSGLAAVTLRAGDGTKLFKQADADLGNPIYHIYSKPGSYTATVTITDAAGNRTTAKSRVNVTTKIATQVAGSIPKVVRHGRNATAKLRTGTSGDLSFQVLNSAGQRVAAKVVHFLKPGKRITASFPTRTLKRGRYTVVLQFTTDHGTAGPVATQPLVVR